VANSSAGSAGSARSAGHRLTTLLAPALEQTGLDIEEVEVTSAGKRRVVRVLVDQDGGVSLDDIAEASQAISAALDGTPEVDSILGSAAYVLEVSSPGVDRPLVEPRQWRRAAGRLVRVPLKAGGEVTGRIVEAGGELGGVRLIVEPGGAQRDLAFDEIGAGRVQVEFKRAGGPADAGDPDQTDDSGATDDDDDPDDADAAHPIPAEEIR